MNVSVKKNIKKYLEKIQNYDFMVFSYIIITFYHHYLVVVAPIHYRFCKEMVWIGTTSVHESLTLSFLKCFLSYNNEYLRKITWFKGFSDKNSIESAPKSSNVIQSELWLFKLRPFCKLKLKITNLRQKLARWERKG